MRAMSFLLLPRACVPMAGLNVREMLGVGWVWTAGRCVPVLAVVSLFGQDGFWAGAGSIS